MTDAFFRHASGDDSWTAARRSQKPRRRSRTGRVPMCSMSASLHKHMTEEMRAVYTAHGLITVAGSRICTSLADTDESIDEALNRFEDVFKLG